MGDLAWHEAKLGQLAKQERGERGHATWIDECLLDMTMRASFLHQRCYAEVHVMRSNRDSGPDPSRC